MTKRLGKLKIMLRALLFVLIFCLLFVWVSYLLRPVDVYRRTIAGYYAEPDNTLDAVYIGGSACFKYWMPLYAFDEQGFTSYNFATDAIPPQFTKYYIAEALKTQSPSLLIIDVRAFEFGDAFVDRGVKFMHRPASLRRGTDSFSYSLNRYNMIRECVPEDYTRLEYIFDIAVYHTNISSLTLENLEYSFNRKSLYTKGYMMQNEVTSLDFNDYRSVTEFEPLSEEMEILLVDLLDYLDELSAEKPDMQVLFTVAPYSLNGEKEQMLHNYMGKLIEERGFDFLDCNLFYEDIGLDFQTDFFDRNHVNTAGAIKYTKYLSRRLQELYGFNDKRSNPAYSSWHRDFELLRGHMSEHSAAG